MLHPVKNEPVNYYALNEMLCYPCWLVTNLKCTLHQENKGALLCVTKEMVKIHRLLCYHYHGIYLSYSQLQHYKVSVQKAFDSHLAYFTMKHFIDTIIPMGNLVSHHLFYCIHFQGLLPSSNYLWPIQFCHTCQNYG